MQITENHADDLYTAMGCIDSVIHSLKLNRQYPKLKDDTK
jgi:hypothetical protein